MKKLMLIFGTRPEAIKMAPLVKIFESDKDFNVRVCVTGQHRQMLDQVLDFFSIKPHYDLNVMKENQSLFSVTADVLLKLEQVLKVEKPDIVLVQGDTTTAFIGALASSYLKIKVGHVEAGLRSSDKYSPFPEEINRVLVGHIADYHFAPTEKARENLNREDIFENVFVVGNTVIDALHIGLEIIDKNDRMRKEIEGYFSSFLNFQNYRLILVTGHRRESFGKGFTNICMALKDISERFEDVEIVYPVHLNPNVREPVNRILNGIPRIHLIQPLEYPYLIWLLSKCYIVLTDSGGIQEESPSLGKPVLVMRDVTERTEGIEAGTAKLVGVDKDAIVRETIRLLDNPSLYEQMSKAVNPYGDGKASKMIIKILTALIYMLETEE